jgi:ADP-ribose pyrophosphatase
MGSALSLPKPPTVALDVIADRSTEPDGFLTFKRYELALVSGAEHSRPFRYDMVERRALDAAVIAAHHVDASGRPYVYLRTSFRPPTLLRPIEPRIEHAFWELPAGLIEPSETPRDGAARELEEELGFSIESERLAPLGPGVFPAPAMIGEIHHFFHVRVDPLTRKEPAGDGSPLEEGARIESVPLEEALAACRRGEVPDAKTELALRRLAEIL